MTLATRLMTVTLKGLTSLLCRIDAGQLARVPPRGPLILVANHVNFLEVPVVGARLQPRPVTGFVKAETWHNPALGWLFKAWGAIPLWRGEADMAAMRRGLAALEEGYILAVAPEGTRSGHGRLQRGHPGVVLLALHSGAPLLPLVYYGAEDYRRDFGRLRRTNFNVVVGQPFYLDARGVKVTRQVRHQMVDEIMYQIAALLPPAYRGCYSDMAAATEMYLRFPAASESNLSRPGPAGSRVKM